MITRSEVSLIVTTEPLFAALTAAVFLGQRFNCFEYLGGALVVAALIGNERRGEDDVFFGAPRRWKEEKVSKRLGPFVLGAYLRHLRCRRLGGSMLSWCLKQFNAQRPKATASMEVDAVNATEGSLELALKDYLEQLLSARRSKRDVF